MPFRRTQKRVAAMQPYFFPYAGYFRLFAMVDEFLLFDCVQFPRRGRVHRSEVPGPNGAPEWLTLPLGYNPRDVLIRELAFLPNARALFDRRLARMPWFSTGAGSASERVREFLLGPMTNVVDYLEAGLRLVIDLLGFDTIVTRTSSLPLDRSLRAQARVLAAAAMVGATHYVNSPGGRAIYEPAAFAHAGIELAFLIPYEGRFFHLLPALMLEPPEEIRSDVLITSRLAES
jgi:hypothetical protein